LPIFRKEFIAPLKNNEIDRNYLGGDYELLSLLVNNPNKFYREMTNSTTLLQKIFSIKNADDKTHKIINILGIKIKIKRRKKISHK
jgi:hypothetical protein